MLLILSNSEDVTADYLASALQRHGVRFHRFDTDTMLGDLTFKYDGYVPVLRVARESYSPDAFSNVWYRRPERLKHSRLGESPEANIILDEWSEALEGFLAHIEPAKWMNHPSRNVAASHKVEQLTIARGMGLSVPDTLVTQEPGELRAFFAKHEGQIIVKPMANGYIERGDGELDSLIYTNSVPQEYLSGLEDLRTCPTLFQQQIRKASDVRITVVDKDIHAVELLAAEKDGSQRCDIRRNNMEDVGYRLIELPISVENRVRAITDHYSLRFAAIDMAVTSNGEWVFFEVNPNGQWAWLDLEGVTDIASSFANSFR